jgi:hypothetical protein
MKNEMSNKQIAAMAIEHATRIIAEGKTIGSDYTIKVGDYSNSVASNKSPKVQAAILLEQIVDELDFTADDIDDAIAMLTAFVEAAGMSAFCKI